MLGLNHLAGAFWTGRLFDCFEPKGTFEPAVPKQNHASVHDAE